MTGPPCTNRSGGTTLPPEDARTRLELLHARLASIRPDRAMESLLANVSEAVERLTVEHTGMAEELLCVYEQLGVVFEMTRKLPSVHDESAVLELFADSLGRSFAQRDVRVIRPTDVFPRNGRDPVCVQRTGRHDTINGEAALPSQSLSACNAQAGGSGVVATGTSRPTGGGSTDEDPAKARPAETASDPTTAHAENACLRAMHRQATLRPQTPYDEWLHDVVRRARDQASVLVETPPTSQCATRVGSDDRRAGSGDRAEAPPSEIMVGPVFAGDSFVCAILLTTLPESGRGDTYTPFRASDMLLLESLTMFCGDIIRNHRLVRELRETSINMVRALVNAVDQKDPYTSGHSLRVGYFATMLGKSLGLGETDRQMLQWSALLHDVGKIGIRDNVLKKAGKLSVTEMNHMREHPVRSHRVVQEVPQLARALDGVLHHHERYDGTGYPQGLAGEQIPIQARIIQMADIFDALTSDRSYRRAFSWQRALEILKKEAGTTVDPQLQAIFDRLIRETLKDDPRGWEKLVERANHGDCRQRFAGIDQRAQGSPETGTTSTSDRRPESLT